MEQIEGSVIAADEVVDDRLNDESQSRGCTDELHELIVGVWRHRFATTFDLRVREHSQMLNA